MDKTTYGLADRAQASDLSSVIIPNSRISTCLSGEIYYRRHDYSKQEEK